MKADLTTTFKFLRQSDHVDSEQLFERWKERATREHDNKLSHILVGKGVKKYFYSIRVVAEWNKLSNKAVITDSKQTFKKTCIMVLKFQEMGTHKCRNFSP